MKECHDDTTTFKLLFFLGNFIKNVLIAGIIIMKDRDKMKLLISPKNI